VLDDMGAPMPAAFSATLCDSLCDALGAATTCDDALMAIHRALVTVVGHNLLTVNIDATQPDDPPDEVQLQRLWTSDPCAYPVGGRKRKTFTPWTRKLLQRAEVFIGEGDAELAVVFEEHKSIAELGLHSVVNVPLLHGARCVATFNVLGTRSQWFAHEVAAIRLLALLAAPWILRARVAPAAAAGE
jgi:hypothetical protein